MKKLIILMFIIVVLVCGCSTKDDGMISVKEVNEIVENYDNYDNVYVIDVREVDEYESGHIKNSINIPLGSLTTIDYDKSAKIIVYCRSGNRSKTAKELLEKLGYTNVYDMGGINNWPYVIEQDFYVE